MTEQENETPSFENGEQTKALITREMLSDMVTTEFQVQGYIPFNVSLEIEEIEKIDDDHLEISVKIKKESVN